MTTLRSISIAERDEIVAEVLAQHRPGIDVALDNAEATIAAEHPIRSRFFWIAIFVIVAGVAVIAGALLGWGGA